MIKKNLTLSETPPRETSFISKIEKERKTIWKNEFGRTNRIAKKSMCETTSDIIIHVAESIFGTRA